MEAAITAVSGLSSYFSAVVALAVEQGIPVVALSSALSYFDAYRTARSNACLLQAQRDYFGAHTYQRVDREGVFHTEWTEA